MCTSWLTETGVIIATEKHQELLSKDVDTRNWHARFHSIFLSFLAMGILASGGADAVIAGGVETMSDVPIRVNRSLRKILLSLNKAKTMGARLGLLSSIRPKHFVPEV